MKQITLLFATLVVATVCSAQPVDKFIWPLEGLKAGEGIISVPQQHIGGIGEEDFNFGNLFIGAPAGTMVIAPTDGTICQISVCYIRSLIYQTSYRNDGDGNYRKAIENIAKELSKDKDPKYLCITIEVNLPDGRRLFISGFSDLIRQFKTGEKIIKGEKLGVLGYSYHKIKEPSLSLSISDRRSQPDDPMTPFGIRTTFIPPKASNIKQMISAFEAKEDFDIFIDALREAYPALRDLISETELDRFASEISSQLDDSIKRSDFTRIMTQVASKIHDSHLSIYSGNGDNHEGVWLPQIYFGWINGRMVATMTTKKYAPYFGRTIKSVDGIPADTIRIMVAKYIGHYDADVRSVKDEMLAMGCANIYSFISDKAKNGDMTLEFADGEILPLKGWMYRGGDPHFVNTWMNYIRVNQYRDANYLLKELNDSTAYIGLSTFSLNQIELDDIAKFIIKQSGKPNMIVDVRKNRGGEVEALKCLLSYFLNAPSKEKGGYNQVYKRNNFKSFANSQNYFGTDSLFNNFVPIEGSEGFFDLSDAAQILPDTIVNYKGHLYVLTDAGSCSAATLFPASILRNHRGVIVGRETATAYHYMTANKFSEYRLPNSHFNVRIPLVKCVFDTTTNARIPYGRGVIPDYEVGLSLDEIFGEKSDTILNYTLSLIDKGIYIGDDPFVANDTLQPESKGSKSWLYVVAIVSLTLVYIVVLVRRRKKKSAGGKTE